jgi:hypothetical protein
MGFGNHVNRSEERAIAVSEWKGYAAAQVALLVLLIALIVVLGRVLHLSDSSLAYAGLPRVLSKPDPSEQLWERVVFAAFVLSAASFAFIGYRTIGKAFPEKTSLRTFELGVAAVSIALIALSVGCPTALTPSLFMEVEKKLPESLSGIGAIIRIADGLGLAIGLTLVTACQSILVGRRSEARDLNSLRSFQTNSIAFSILAQRFFGSASLHPASCTSGLGPRHI